MYSLILGGAATFVSALTSPLGSDMIGIDFNPVADLAGMTSLRIVSSTGQNFAYNDLNPATGTALYYIDAASDTLRFGPGAFNNPTLTTIGSLGHDATGVSGFDILGSSSGFAALTAADTGKSGLYSINIATGAATFVGAFGIGGNTAIAPPLLGLSAVAVAPVPEPETYAMMLAGLMALGHVARRRRVR